MSIVQSFLRRAGRLLSPNRRTPRRSRSSSQLYRFQPCVEALEDRFLLAVRTWTGAAGGGDIDWSNAANWQNNLKPGAGDTARFLNNAVNSRVDAAFAGQIMALDIQSTYTGTLTIARELDVSGTINVAGGAVTIASGGGLLDIRGNTTIDGRIVTNQGFISWTAGGIDFQNGGTLHNVGGTFFDSTSVNSLITAGVGGGVFRISGAGSYSKNSDTFVTVGMGVEFQLDGALASVNLNQAPGELNLKGGGRSSGKFAITQGAFLTFGDGTFQVNAGTQFTGDLGGTYGFVRLRDGNPIVSVNANVVIPNLTVSRGELTGAGSVTVSNPGGGTFNWLGGKLSGTGDKVANVAVSLNIDSGFVKTLDQAKLKNFGFATWKGTGNIEVSGGGQIITDALGLPGLASFDIQNDQTIRDLDANPNNAFSFQNGGVVRKTAGTGLTIIELPNKGTGGGTIELRGRRIQFGKGVQISGTTNLEGGTLTVLGDFDQDGGSTTLGGGILSVTGALNLNAGTLTLDAAASLTATAGLTIQSGATLDGAGTITANVQNGGTINVGGTGVAGTVAITGNYNQTAGGILRVEFGAPGSADLLSVSGIVTLAGNLQTATLSGFVGGSPLTVIDNTGASPISGYFTNLPQGTRFRLDTWLYEITYTGGNGNDVVLNPVTSGQWANNIINVSSEFNASPGDYSAAKALGAPDVTAYGDNPKAWSPLSKNGTQETITLGYATAVYAQGVTIREVNGNGFVTRVDLIDTTGTPHTVWAGTDPTQPGSPGELTLSFAPANYLVNAVKVYVNTDTNASTWEQIDAVILYGQAGGGGFAPTGGGGLAGALTSLRISALSRPGSGPTATFAVSGPVALGAPVTFTFSSPGGGSGYRYSFDFNNDGDFLDAGEVQDGTSPSARYTFTTRGWHVVRGRIRAADGRFTDYWVRVFVA
jgi:hypothetical protein